MQKANTDYSKTINIHNFSTYELTKDIALLSKGLSYAPTPTIPATIFYKKFYNITTNSHALCEQSLKDNRNMVKNDRMTPQLHLPNKTQSEE